MHVHGPRSTEEADVRSTLDLAHASSCPAVRCSAARPQVRGNPLTCRIRTRSAAPSEQKIIKPLAPLVARLFTRSISKTAGLLGTVATGYPLRPGARDWRPRLPRAGAVAAAGSTNHRRRQRATTSEALLVAAALSGPAACITRTYMWPGLRCCRLANDAKRDRSVISGWRVAIVA